MYQALNKGELAMFVTKIIIMKSENLRTFRYLILQFIKMVIICIINIISLDKNAQKAKLKTLCPQKGHNARNWYYFDSYYKIWRKARCIYN